MRRTSFITHVWEENLCRSALGMPKPRPAVLSPRRKTRQFTVGSVGVGSESPISVQSMTTKHPRHWCDSAADC